VNFGFGSMLSSSAPNLAKEDFWLPPLLLQASVGRARSSVVAFLRFDVVPHSGMRGLHQRRWKIQFTREKNPFRHYRSASEVVRAT
jgi:hypothetical protein